MARLTVMHNIRGYGQEPMLVQGIANRRNGSIDTSHIGASINDPPSDYAKFATGMGVWSVGPITDQAKLAPALKQAVAVVKQGQPASSAAESAAAGGDRHLHPRHQPRRCRRTAPGYLATRTSPTLPPT